MSSRLPKGTSATVILVPLLVTIFLVILNVSSGTFWSLYDAVAGTPEDETAAPAPYNSSDGILLINQAEPNEPTDGREPWLGEEAWIAGVQAGQEYIGEFPEPQNVQVLKGMDTGEIWGYMIHISGSLGVGCQYCHDINNFAADPYPAKISARLMLRLVNDLNGQFLSQIPTWGGNYVQCATCHHGQPNNMLAFSERNDYRPVNAVGEVLQPWSIDTYAIATSTEFVNQHPTTGKMLSMVNYMRENWDRYVLPTRRIRLCWLSCPSMIDRITL